MIHKGRDKLDVITGQNYRMNDCILQSGNMYGKTFCLDFGMQYLHSSL